MHRTLFLVIASRAILHTITHVLSTNATPKGVTCEMFKRFAGVLVFFAMDFAVHLVFPVCAVTKAVTYPRFLEKLLVVTKIMHLAYSMRHIVIILTRIQRWSVHTNSSEVQFCILLGSQLSSSPPSAQSRSVSHRQRSGMHLPSLHLLRK